MENVEDIQFELEHPAEETEFIKKKAPKSYDQMKKEPDLSDLSPKKNSESFDEN